MRCSCSTCTRPARCGLRGGSHKLARAAVRRANGASPHATPGAHVRRGLVVLDDRHSCIETCSRAADAQRHRMFPRPVGYTSARVSARCSNAYMFVLRPTNAIWAADRAATLPRRASCVAASAADSRAVRRSAQMNRRRHLSQFASGTRCVVSRETAACRCNAWHTDGPARGCADSTISVASVWLATTISVGVSHSAASHSSASTPGGTLSSALEPAVRGGNGRRHTDPAGTSGFADQAAKVL